jgi:hypothetical protein
LVTVRGARCSRGRREEHPGEPSHDRHADDGECGSAAVRPERGKVSYVLLGALGAPCIERRRKRVEMVHHGPRVSP